MAKPQKQLTGRERRKLRNLLLDRRFQLKYAGLLAGVAALLSIGLGVVLWRTSNSLVLQSRQTVEQGQQVVSLGRKVADESRKVSDVVEMNIVKDPVYADNPELLDVFKADSAKRKGQIEEQQKALELQASALTRQAAELQAGQQTLLITIFSLLGALVVVLTLVGIYVTHKVAGPIFKMTGQVRSIGEGDWRVPWPLRKGDELTQFWSVLETAVKALREQREGELKALDAALESLGAKVEKSDLAQLEQLRAELHRPLER